MATDTADIVPITTPIRVFEGHEESVLAVAVSPDGRRMITSGKTLRLWDLEGGVVLKNMEGHHGSRVWAVAVSQDGQLIASGDVNGELIVWHGETGQVAQAIKAHSTYIRSLDFSPNDAVLATTSWDNTTKLYSTQTWQLEGDPIECSDYCVRYSPSGNLLAIATRWDIKIWDTSTRKLIANLEAHSTISRVANFSLAWTRDGTRLLSSGSRDDPTIREWDSSTWGQVGDPWKGHTDYINAIAMNPDGTLVASASDDNHVRLWRLEDRRTIAIFKHTSQVYCATFSIDGKHVLSGGNDKKISEWAVPGDHLPDDAAEEQATNENSSDDRVPHTEIPGQGQDDRIDYVNRFWGGTDDRPDTSLSRQCLELLKRLSTFARTRRSAPSSAPPVSSENPPITFKARLQHLLTRRPGHSDHAASRIVNVPFAKGKLRNAAAGAPTNDDGCIRDEDYVPDLPTSPDPDARQSSTAAQVNNAGEHESRGLCFCLYS
ncbi:WD40 repeat-like protein [Rhizopogon vinicolor AM-OR11-026]|uniref:WD40 repeat-like protein n=1 Tax=Rhizopogon vinicolor AM-OR11-026 TaxID=1314800 RepID=A0A1B7MTS8_9AGAM|nr:WD40 repeat-like protein [Rhizopogon vinicolor AM-OR11-026]